MILDFQPTLERIMKHMLMTGLPLLAACGSSAVPVPEGGGGDAGTQPLACQPFQAERGFLTTCGSGPYAADPPFVTLPPDVVKRSFDPNDARWRDLYRACLAQDAGTTEASCEELCIALNEGYAPKYLRCELSCDGPKGLTISTSNAACGRRAGSSRRRGRECDPTSSPLGRYLAHAARLEAESVPAFGRLAKGLARYDAPASLVESARRAMADEGRHWRQTRAVARRHGANPAHPRVRASDFGSLAELALDNVTEGCVRETLGAVIASHQACTAKDPDMRALMTAIAVDETAHATLAWQIDAWTAKELGPAFQARRQAAGRAAIAELVANLGAPAEDEVFLAQAGLPNQRAARAMLGIVWTEAWDVAFAGAA